MQSMRYVDSRGIDPRKLDACEVVLEGATNSKGLWVPKEIPKFTDEELISLQGSSLKKIMIIFLEKFGFIGEHEIPLKDAELLVENAYKDFHHEDVISLESIDDHDNFILNLNHGPTLSFKDNALALLGQVIPYLLKKQGIKGVVLGATSGDTGPAGMANVASDDTFVIITYPYKGTSIGQEQQMIHYSGKNAQAYAVEGMTFDDCQDLVKECFNDLPFLTRLKRNELKLISINSINWLRIMAQAAYMFYVSVNPVFKKSPFLLTKYINYL